MNKKPISIPEDLYLALKKEMRKGESIADFFRRLINPKEKKRFELESVAGRLKDDDDWDDIVKEIYQQR